MIRMGKDLFFGTGNIINKLNEDNFMKKWRRLFSEYNIHSIDTVGHIDGHTVPIKPGLILSTKFPEFYKDSFPDWEVVRCRTDSMKPWKIKNKKITQDIGFQMQVMSFMIMLTSGWMIG